MRCSNCGREFEAHEAMQDCCYENVSDECDQRKIVIFLCPECAHERSMAIVWYLWFFFLLAAGAAAIGLLTQGF